MQLHGTADERWLRRRLKASLDAHRRRAAADRQLLDYTAADLAALVEAAGRCAYCGALLTPATFSIDHALPTCRTADYGLGNLAVCCAGCQRAKGQLSAAEFRALMELMNGWHPRARQDVLARLRSGGRRYAGR